MTAICTKSTRRQSGDAASLAGPAFDTRGGCGGVPSGSVFPPAVPLMDDYRVLRYLTSTVGLVSARGSDDFLDVMAAEWTSFVARNPLHIAVGIQTHNLTHDLITESNEFAVTLCDVRLAGVAELCGTFSGRDVDKTSSDSLRMQGPRVGGVPHVAGGVMNAECTVRCAVPLPGYTLFVGEAVWWQVDDERAQHPLVKHGQMYELGAALAAREVCTSVRRLGDSIIVAATAHGAPRAGHWRVQIQDDYGQVLADELVPVDGDLLQRLQLPSGPGEHPSVVQVERAGCTAGRASIRPTPRLASPEGESRTSAGR